jgi:DNA-binding CsgD family transcriptional regulator
VLRQRIDLERRRDVARVERALGRIRRDVDATKLLTRRQRQALQRMSHGLTYEEAAAELGIGLETVKEHMKGARSRLNALNTNHAIAEAIRLGLIE